MSSTFSQMFQEKIIDMDRWGGGKARLEEGGKETANMDERVIVHFFSVNWKVFDNKTFFEMW